MVEVPALSQPAAGSASGTPPRATSSRSKSGSSASSERTPSAQHATLACGECGRKFKTQLLATSRQTTCAGCGIALTIPAKSQKRAAPATGSESPQENDLWDEISGDLGSSDEPSGLSLAEFTTTSAPTAPAPKLRQGRARGRRSFVSFDNPTMARRTVGVLAFALAVAGALLWGVTTGNLLAASYGLLRFGVFLCYVIVIVRMFQNGRYGMGLFSIFGSFVGVAIIIGSGASLMMAESSPDALPVALGAMGMAMFGMALILISLFTPFVMGWVQVNHWRLGTVMLVWTVCGTLSFVLSAFSGAQGDTGSDLAATPSVTSGGLTARNAKSGPHVKLSNAVYTTKKRMSGWFTDYGTSVDYAFDRETTDLTATYYRVIESPLGKAEYMFSIRGQGTMQTDSNQSISFGNAPRSGKAELWKCWVEMETRDARGDIQPRRRVSEIVSMRPASTLPHPKEFVRLFPSTVVKQSAPKEPKKMSTAESPPKPAPRAIPQRPKELTFDDVLGMLEESDKKLVKSALRWLRDHTVDEEQQPEVAARLAPLLEHPDRFLRRDAAKMLRHWATAEQIPPLIAVLQDELSGVQNEARDTLATFVDPRAAEALVRHMEKDRSGAARALKKMGPPAEEAVIVFLEHPDPALRAEASSILAEIGTTQGMTALKQLATDRSRRVQLAAEKAYYQIEFRLKQERRTNPSNPQPVDEPSS